MKKFFILIGIILSGIINYAQIQPNNLCASATTLTVGATCTNNTFTMPATFTNDGYTLAGCNIGNTRDDGWYKFQATSIVTEITIDAAQDIIIHVYSGTCGAFTLIGCADNQTTAAEVLNIPTTVGTWYYIRIQRYNSSSGITGGTICLYSTNTCNWTLCLQDSYGDGWNGANLQVFVNGVSIGYAELLSGAGPTCYMLPAAMSGNVSIVFNSGTYDSECSYYLYNDLNVLYHTEVGPPGNFSYTQTCNGSLPIELLGTPTIICENNTRRILWVTASEHNTAIFTVQSSEDGMFWNNVASLPAAGNSNSPRSYSVVDIDIYGPSTVLYQILQIDNDGQFHIFGLYPSTCETTTDILEIYPNPSHEGDIVLIKGYIKNIEIYDLLGRKINAKIDGSKLVGLSAGVYVILDDGIFITKLVIN
jgi:hypothetical protein